jgi:hypothetical protein
VLGDAEMEKSAAGGGGGVVTVRLTLVLCVIDALVPVICSV